MEDGLQPRAVDCPGGSGSARHGEEEERHGLQEEERRESRRAAG